MNLHEIEVCPNSKKVLGPCSGLGPANKNLFVKGMETKILNEIDFTIEDIRKRTCNGVLPLEDIDKYFDLPDLNVIWGLVAGFR